jgi:hypothetical protein
MLGQSDNRMQGNLGSLQAKIQSDMLNASSPSGGGKAKAKAKAKGKAKAKAKAKAELGTPVDAKIKKRPSAGPDMPVDAKIRKKPAATTPKTKNVATKTVEELGDNPSVAAVLQAHRSIFHFPKVVDKLLKAKGRTDRPKPTRDATWYFGGRLYTVLEKSGRILIRCYKRSGDTQEQRIAVDWTDKSDRDAMWGLACAVIEHDPRERKLD